MSSAEGVNRPRVLSFGRMQCQLLDHLGFYILIFLDQLELPVWVVRNMVWSQWMTSLDSHGLYSQSIRMKLMRPLKCFKKKFKMKRVSVSCPSDQIMAVRLKAMLLKAFVTKMAFITISLLLELLNKMGLLKGRTNLYKKWLKPGFVKWFIKRFLGTSSEHYLLNSKSCFLNANNQEDPL